MDRYRRQTILPGFGASTQEKLRNAHVLVVGAGGLGSPALQYLAGVGLGKISIVDGDKVSLDNLHRQTLFAEKHVGQKKAQVAAEVLRNLNSEIQIVNHDFYLTIDNVQKVFTELDLVLDCTDNLEIRYLLNDFCAWKKVPLVFAAIHQFQAQMSVFHLGANGFSLRDVFPEKSDENSIINCAEGGVLGTVAGIIGLLQAQEAIKIIGEWGEVYSGKLLVWDFLKNSQMVLTLDSERKTKNPKSLDEIKENYYSSLHSQIEILSNRQEVEAILQKFDVTLVDVREKDEIVTNIPFNTMHIPMSQLEKSVEDIASDKVLIFLCASGVRSLKAAQIYNKTFPSTKVYSLGKGAQILEEDLSISENNSKS